MKKVQISPSFWVMAAAVWLVEPELLLPTVLAAACHELGHVTALFAMGGRAEGFTLAALGAELKLACGLSYAQELPVALAGPLCSLALAFGAVRLDWFLLAGLSLALGLFNLLPVWPLDGGRIVACLGGMFLQPLAAQRIERIFSAVALGALLALGLIAARQGFGPGLLCMTLWLCWKNLRPAKNT